MIFSKDTFAAAPFNLNENAIACVSATRERMSTEQKLRQLHGRPIAAMQRFWAHTRWILISLGHPYYLYDAPRMPCVINAYCAIGSMQRALARKFLGEEPFEGKFPADAPF